MYIIINIVSIKHFHVGFMVSDIPSVSVFGHCPYSVTFPYIVYLLITIHSLFNIDNQIYKLIYIIYKYNIVY